MRFVVRPHRREGSLAAPQGSGLGVMRSPAWRSSRSGKRTAARGARLGACGHLGSAPGAPPLGVLLPEPHTDPDLTQAPRVCGKEAAVGLSHVGAADPVARVVRAIGAEGHAAMLGACLDLALSAEAKRRGGTAARADQTVRRRVQILGKRLQSRDILLRPGEVYGTCAAVRATDAREARIDAAVVDDQSDGHRGTESRGRGLAPA